jgi:hypothetical protein
MCNCLKCNEEEEEEEEAEEKRGRQEGLWDTTFIARKVLEQSGI